MFERNRGGADNWGEVIILRASDAQACDCFGGSVSISGDTLVVGAKYEDGGVGDLNRELAIRHLEVVPYNDDELVLEWALTS